MTISRNQELYSPEPRISIDYPLIETNINSNIVTVMQTITEKMVEDESIRANIQDLIETTFTSGSQIKADLTTLKTFASELNILLNG
jgi:hypothetical protein